MRGSRIRWGRGRSAGIIAIVALAAAGCGAEGGAEPDAAGTPDGIETTEVGTDGEQAAGNPCGPDATGDPEGPPGEAPADGSEEVAVTGVEYAFEGLEDSYAAGDYGFRFVNDGAEMHEFVLLRLSEGVTADDLLTMSDEEAEGAIEFATGAIACPGDEADPVGATLEPGNYVAVCFLPVGSTPDADLEQIDGPPHAEEGMMHGFTVP